MAKIFYIMGKSASGKDTIFHRLINDDALSLHIIIGYTTRPPRQGEEDGREYHFVSDAEMKKMENEGKIIERRQYHTIYGMWHYFTADDGQIDLQQYDYIVIGTLESYHRMREYFGKDRIIPIYIELDDGVRLERAISRERSQESPGYSEVCRRFLADEEDFCEDKICESNIVNRFENIELEHCIKNIKQFILEVLYNSNRI